MIKTTLLSVLALFCVTRVAECASQSSSEDQNEEPMGSLENVVRQRQIETPQVVLQLKYDDGELNRVYLAQFRKTEKSAASVPTWKSSCTDLCHSGLGGEPCGASCLELVPVGLHSALNNTIEVDPSYGQPRVDVCPTLCENQLGVPLCGCGETTGHAVDWSAVCSAFCASDNYVLGGCPPCQESSHLASHSRILNTSEGWSAWCNVQCQQGNGGAACNCDRTPFQ